MDTIAELYTKNSLGSLSERRRLLKRGTKRALLVVLLSLLASSSVIASRFVPISISDDVRIARWFVNSSGQYAYTVEQSTDDGENFGTLYVNGGPFVNYGRPGDDFLTLRDAAPTASGAIFVADAYRDLVNRDPDDTLLRVFDGPNPSYEPPFLPPYLGEANPNWFSRERFSARSDGDYSLVLNGGTFWVRAPRLGYLQNEARYNFPSWFKNLSTPPTQAELPDQISVLEDGRVVAITGRCVQRYFRGELLRDETTNARGGPLEFESEACADSSQTDRSSIAPFGELNQQTGDVAFCGKPAAGGQWGIYRVSGGAVSHLIDVDAFNCAVVGSDAAGNVAYSDGFGIYLSNNPAEPVVAAGQLFEGRTILSANGLGVMNNGSIIALASLRDPVTLETQSGLLFADGDTEFPPDPNDPPPDVVLWNSSTDGSFSDETNWNPEVVPDSEQVAVFGPEASYFVNFVSEAAVVKRLRVDAGFPFFTGGTLQLSSGSAASPSFVLEPSGPASVSLQLQGGHQLQTRHARLSSRGVLLVGMFLNDDPSAPEPRSRWDNIGRLTVDANLAVGLSGGLVTDSLRVGSEPGTEGTVTVSADELGFCQDISKADFGQTSIGYLGKGTLEIGETCNVEPTGDRVIGEFSGSQGIVTLDGGVWDRLFTQGPPTNLTVGREGDGTLNVSSGGVGARNLHVGELVSGVGRMELNQTASTPSFIQVSRTLLVGGAGEAVVHIRDGSQITAENIEIGAYPGGNGTVSVSGSPFAEDNLSAISAITIGAQGSGSLDIGSNAIVASTSGVIGQTLGGSGDATISQSGSWILDETLTVGSASTGENPDSCDGDEISIAVGTLNLLGDGVLADASGQTLTVDGPQSVLSGTGRLAFTNTVLKNCGRLAPGNSPGTLTVDGDLDFRSGVLVIEMTGLGDGEYDLVKVTGDADLSGGIVRFVFSGFLPQQGDQITFVEADGALTSSGNLAFEYVGANDGFDFDVTTDDEGMLSFTANNDAIDELFINGFEGQ